MLSINELAPDFRLEIQYGRVHKIKQNTKIVQFIISPFGGIYFNNNQQTKEIH